MTYIDKRFLTGYLDRGNMHLCTCKPEDSTNYLKHNESIDLGQRHTRFEAKDYFETSKISLKQYLNWHCLFFLVWVIAY